MCYECDHVVLCCFYPQDIRGRGGNGELSCGLFDGHCQCSSRSSQFLCTNSRVLFVVVPTSFFALHQHMRCTISLQQLLGSSASHSLLSVCVFAMCLSIFCYVGCIIRRFWSMPTDGSNCATKKTTRGLYLLPLGW